MFSPAWQWEIKRVGGISSVTFVYLVYLGIFSVRVNFSIILQFHTKCIEGKIMCIINVINFYRDVHFEQYLETLS